MSRMKTAVIIIVIAALVAAIAAGVWYYKTKFYVPDKNGMVYYDADIPSYDLCLRLIKEKGLLFTPGEAFEMEGAVRIGYAFDSKLLKEGLEVFADFLKEL